MGLIKIWLMVVLLILVEGWWCTCLQGGEEEEEGGLVDMDAFYVALMVSHTVSMVATCVVLYMNPHWRRALFHSLELKFINCYQFLIDNVPFLSRLGVS
ncbi:hypothetical protein Tsubulata_045618 [Turnera subulata]|uniref:Uncharacterized protein n=1 Tax=Turnera subulata TaxID=218843 RepID=A0A9Q0FHG6_9ROSI|nr:hypothetical protein Tsubulata_045618 [Turnera subulata]